jgi:GDPmannose 4,6-dehydratase
MVVGESASEAVGCFTGAWTSVFIGVDPRYFRPTEVETLSGDATTTKGKLGSTPRTNFDELVVEVARQDVRAAERAGLITRCSCKAMGYTK